jgi:putative ABC transport system permease protein
MRDIRYAFRVLRRAPGFTSAVVAVLALGIGANSAIFSVVDAAFLRPLPYQQPRDLVMLWERAPSYPHNRVSPLNFQDWHDQNRVFTGLAAVSGGSRTLVGRDGAEQIPGQAVTRDFFDVLGIRPILGRGFNDEDERAQAPVVVISESLWKRRFAGDRTIAGRAVVFDGKAFTVIGVAPAGFQIFYPAELWTLYIVKRSPEQRRMHYLQVIGRLKPGVSISQANAAMAGIALNIAVISPATNKNWSILLEPLRDAVVGGELRTTTLVLAGVVGLVLLMGCANVANLMLARGVSRAREMAIRVSLGAGGGTLARQLLAEALMLAAAGGAAGLALAWALVRVAPGVIPDNTLPTGVRLALDTRVSAFTMLLTLAAGVLVAVAPGWQASRGVLAAGLRGGGRGGSSAHAGLLDSLAAAEIAIAVLVVAGAGLFLRTLERLIAVDGGFRGEHVLTARVSLPLSRYPTPARAGEFYQAAQRELESIPGVRSAALGGSVPLAGWDIGQGFRLSDETTGESLQASAHYQIVGARYFETLGIPLLAGRAFEESDSGGAPQVAIVNQEFVRKYLHGRPAVGKHVVVQAMDPRGPTPIDREIVGVIGQVKVEGLGEKENSVEVYVPITQNPWYWATIAVRAEGPPAAVASAVKAAVGRVDRELAVTQMQTMAQLASDSVARPRFRARLLAALALLALVLSAAGVFGVLAFAVSQRRREFGIRMALGAQIGDVLSLVAARGVKITAAGIAVGLAGASALARSAATLLFGVKAFDGGVYLGAAAVLAFVALAAAAIPAWRAAHVDPAVTLREE